MDFLNPAAASAHRVDQVFLYTVGLSVVFLVFITALMIWFTVRYRRSRHPVAAQIEGHTGLEITWTLIPLVLFLVIFAYGWTDYATMRHPPRDAMVVKVTARQWAWSFEYPNGRQTSVLYAPLQRPVKLEVRTVDVIHGFYVAAFRLKIDAVPTLVNTAWFRATRPGAYDIQCTVICGASHSAMLSKVVAVPEEAFRAWYFGGEDAPEPALPVSVPETSPKAPGRLVMEARGCLACHSLDGSPRVGPTLKGVYGRREEILVGGQPRTVVLDDQQLRRAILKPGGEIVRGYPPSMPPAGLEEGELAQVVEYLRSLR